MVEHRTVVVLGAPNTGTHWMQRILDLCGAPVVRDHTHKADEHLANARFCVVMVRGIARWRQSAHAKKRFGDYSSTWWCGSEHNVASAHHTSYAEIFRALDKHKVPFAIIPYEAMVADPDDTVAELCKWADLTFGGWTRRTRAVDGNQKWREATPSPDEEPVPPPAS